METEEMLGLLEDLKIDPGGEGGDGDGTNLSVFILNENKVYVCHKLIGNVGR